MSQPDARNQLDRDVVLRHVVTILKDMVSVSDWEGFEGQIGPDTLLVGDLAFSSVEIVEMTMIIEDHFNLPFQSQKLRELLMTADDLYNENVRVSDLVDVVSSACLAPGDERGRPAPWR